MLLLKALLVSTVACSITIDGDKFDAVEMQRYAQYSVLNSFCLDSSFCLRNLTRCVEELALTGALAPILTLPTSTIRFFSTYNRQNKFGGKGSFMLYEGEKPTLVVTFAGSTVPGDWLNDMRISLTDYEPLSQDLGKLMNLSGARVHHGFQSIFKTLRPVLIDIWNDFVRTSDVAEVVITGWSLGGSLANLFFFDLLVCLLLIRHGKTCPLMLSSLKKLKLYTYGQPRLGNRALMSIMDDIISMQEIGNNVETFRLAARGDIVPLLPPLSLGFSHFREGKCYMVERNGTISQPQHLNHNEDRGENVNDNGHAMYFWNFEAVKKQCYNNAFMFKIE